jgi:hypothetical protein
MSHPTTVFVAGSRQISRLPAEVGSRLDTMIEKGFEILVGDANGADKAVQRYLADKSYPNVLVHCMKDHCRNNVGNCQRVRSRPRAAPEASSTTPSRTARWLRPRSTGDGKSKGTVNNVVNLSRDHKPVVVYVAPIKQFRTIKTSNDLKDLLAQGDSDSVKRIVNERHLVVQSHRAAG